jgi:hypothetical protein
MVKNSELDDLACMQVVRELQARSAGGPLPHQEACNVLWGLAALDQLTRAHLEQFVGQLAGDGAISHLSKAEAMQLRQVCHS